MAEQAQNFENHPRLVTPYHKVAFPLVLLPTLYFAYLAVTDFELHRLALVAFCMGMIIMGLFGRLFPLGVQDRVIRLEERMRMELLLPDDLKGRIADFTTPQLIALRFASDEELPDLAGRVLKEGMSDRKEIKQAVKNWRADNQRI